VGLCRAVAKKLEDDRGAKSFCFSPRRRARPPLDTLQERFPQETVRFVIDQVCLRGEYNIYLKKAEAAETMILFEYLKQVEVLRIEGILCWSFDRLRVSTGVVPTT